MTKYVDFTFTAFISDTLPRIDDIPVTTKLEAFGSVVDGDIAYAVDAFNAVLKAAGVDQQVMVAPKVVEAPPAPPPNDPTKFFNGDVVVVTADLIKPDNVGKKGVIVGFSPTMRDDQTALVRFADGVIVGGHDGFGDVADVREGSNNYRYYSAKNLKLA